MVNFVNILILKSLNPNLNFVQPFKQFLVQHIFVLKLYKNNTYLSI